MKNTPIMRLLLVIMQKHRQLPCDVAAKLFLAIATADLRIPSSSRTVSVIAVVVMSVSSAATLVTLEPAVDAKHAPELSCGGMTDWRRHDLHPTAQAKRQNEAAYSPIIQAKLVTSP